MKTKTAILAAVAILLAVGTGIAQNALTQPVPAGPKCQLAPEQRAARQQQMTAVIEQLRQKKAAGTITDAENLWLTRMEQRGGVCVNGTPRCGTGQRNGTGPCAQAGTCPTTPAQCATAPACQPNGKGRGMGAGQGRGAGMGLKNGTGPRSLNGTCPMQNTAPAN